MKPDDRDGSIPVGDEQDANANRAARPPAWEVYFNDGHGWQPSNLGRFATRAEAEAGRGDWLLGYTAHGRRETPATRIALAGALGFVDPAELAALRACAEALRGTLSPLQDAQNTGRSIAAAKACVAARAALAALDAARGEG